METEKRADGNTRDCRDYYEKLCVRIRLARYGTLLLLVCFLLFSITVYREQITFDNFKYLIKYLEVSPPILYDGDKSITFSAASDASFTLLDDKLTMQSGESVVSYDMAGRKLLNENISYKNAAVTQNNHYMLVYDLDGIELSVYNSFSKVCEKKLSSAIDYVYLGDDGSFAVITNEKSYAGGFEIYDSSGKKLYSFMTRTASVTDVCCDAKKDIAACATTDARDGDFFSEIYSFDLSNDEQFRAKTELVGEMPLSMLCTDKSIALLTDNGIHYYDYDLNELLFTDFDYETPDALYRFGDFFAVVLKSSLAGTESEVRLFSYDGSLLYKAAFKSEISSVHAANGYVCILEPYLLSILQYDDAYNITPLYSLQVDGEYRSAFVLPDDEYLLVSSGGALKAAVASTDEDKDADKSKESASNDDDKDDKNQSESSSD